MQLLSFLQSFIPSFVAFVVMSYSTVALLQQNIFSTFRSQAT